MNLFSNPYQYSYNQHNGIQWVQGVEGAKAFQLQPNSNAILMDSENDGIFYIKVSDNVGMCTLRTFKYTEVTTNNSQANLIESVFLYNALKSILRHFSISDVRNIIYNTKNANMSVLCVSTSISESSFLSIGKIYLFFVK